MRGLPTATRLSSIWQERPTFRVVTLLTVVVGAFSGLWLRGAVVLDGQGVALYTRLASDYLTHQGRIPYWLPEMWSGAPVWVLVSTFPIMLMLPVTAVAGSDAALKAGVLAFQVIGGVGAYALARSLWGRGPAPVLAGLFYSLHPMIISHGALVGLEPVLGVTAATPWLAWSFRLALLGAGRRYVVLAGMAAAFAVLHQAEYALALPLMCGFMFVVGLARSRHDRSGGSPRDIFVRTGAIVGLAAALCAVWLLPLAVLRKSFVLSPPALVQAELTGGPANRISNDIGIFFTRPAAVAGAVGHQRTDLIPPLFYLGLVAAALTLVTLVLLPRHDRDGHLTAILVASGTAVWFSTGAVPLISSGAFLRHQVVPLAVTGLATGLLLTAFVRHLRLRRWQVVAFAAVAILVVAVPFVTPYTTLQKVVPIFAVIRFPRFYTLAALGLSLGGAYPVAILARRVNEGFRLPALLPAGVAVALALAFFVDILPYRSLYELHPPSSAAAYDAAAEALPRASAPFRVAPGLLEPGATTRLLENGLLVTSGWPHPLAGRQLWRLTGEPYVGPTGLREAAFGLSATTYIALERVIGLGTPDQAVTEVVMARNVKSLPFIRAYEQAVVVDDPDLAPLLATNLAYRNVGVITRRQPVDRLLADMPTAVIGRDQGCDRPSVAALGPLAGQVATACALDPWLSAVLAGVELVRADESPGAVFTAQADGLRGISLYLDSPPGRAELALYEVGPDGRTLGPEIARAEAVGIDENGLAAFAFDPIVQSAGHRYEFILSCGSCPPAEVPRMIAGVVDDGRGDFTVANQQRKDKVAAYAPIHDEIPPATPVHATIRAESPAPGSWRISADEPNPSILVVAETWFPGWTAKVDGKSTPVLQADGAFLGVAVGAGAHTVELDYHRPGVAWVGRAITLGTLLAIFVGYWRRPRHPTGAPETSSDPDGGWNDAVAPSRRSRRPRPGPAAPPDTG